jgi:hypothetical protein
MRFISFERGDGSTACINPLQVRAVVFSTATMTYVQFDSDHVIMVKGSVEQVARSLEGAG